MRSVPSLYSPNDTKCCTIIIKIRFLAKLSGIQLLTKTPIQLLCYSKRYSDETVYSMKKMFIPFIVLLSLLFPGFSFASAQMSDCCASQAMPSLCPAAEIHCDQHVSCCTL